VVCSLGGCSLSSNNNAPVSDAERFHRSLEFFPAGKTMYWFGPRSNGFVLRYPLLTVQGATGTGLGYARAGTYVVVTTFLDDKVPRVDTIYPSTGVLLGTALMPTGQRVGIKMQRGVRPPQRDISKLLASLRPVTGADIDRLPKNWHDIH
jgi:hypothetical protein